MSPQDEALWELLEREVVTPGSPLHERVQDAYFGRRTVELPAGDTATLRLATHQVLQTTDYRATLDEVADKGCPRDRVIDWSRRLR